MHARIKNPITRQKAALTAFSISIAAAAVCGLISCGSADGGDDASSQAAAGSPKAGLELEQGMTSLVFETTQIDLGEAWEGEVLVPRFVGRVGPADLKLVAVSPDCGCATPELFVVEGDAPRRVDVKDVIPAGSEIELRVQYDTQGRPGKLPRTIKLYGNIAGEKSGDGGGIVRVTFEAEVRPWLISEPALADLGRVRPNEARTATFRLRAHDGSPIRLEENKAQHPTGVTTTLAAVDPEPDGRAVLWTLDVHIGSALARGKHRFPFPLISDRLRPDATDDDPQTFQATANLLVEGAGLTSLKPGVINLGRLDADTTVVRSVRLSVHQPGLRLGTPTARLVAATTADLVQLRSSGGVLALSKTVTITPRRVPGQPAWDLEVLVRGLDPGVPSAFAAFLEVDVPLLGGADGAGDSPEPPLRVLVQGIRAD